MDKRIKIVGGASSKNSVQFMTKENGVEAIRNEDHTIELKSVNMNKNLQTSSSKLGSSCNTKALTVRARNRIVAPFAFKLQLNFIVHL